ncbi:MAG: peptidoglycan DD-metalloendopeptidase family protein [Xanthomonadales bacterium]|nr:peptidoglycan DD-metalloendopeptidase family protein [Xanthomonadales bacterium]
MQRLKLNQASLALWLLLMNWCAAPALIAQNKGTASPRQQEIEQQLAQLQQDIQQLQQSLLAARSDHRIEQDQLKQLDLSIQQSSQAIRELDTQLAEHSTELARLETEREQQLQQLHIDQQQLAEQIGATYRLSRQSRLKLVFNQDSPTELSRMLAYYEHINRAQTSKIVALRETLASLEAIYQRIGLQLREIATAQQLQQQELLLKQQQRDKRQVVLAKLQKQIGSSEAQLEEFEKNRLDLEALLEKLSDVLADIPSDLGQHLSVSAQKGRLPTPVQAKVRKAFGQQRSGGMYWQGWVFDAPPGEEVNSVAYGRVAFADWLRGYGLMIIIDHGGGFMSLYGYNESLLWEVGDWVEPGKVIATVGSNSAGEQGLYFELRKDGKALDPAAWLKR